MSHTVQERQVDDKSSARRPMRRAWISVGLMPVVLIVAFISSEFIFRLAGYDPGGTVPLWFDIAVWSFTMGVFAVPSVAAIVYGREAYRSGDRRGRVPLLIGSIAVVLVLAMAVQAIASSEHL